MDYRHTLRDKLVALRDSLQECEDNGGLIDWSEESKLLGEVLNYLEMVDKSIHRDKPESLDGRFLYEYDTRMNEWRLYQDETRMGIYSCCGTFQSKAELMDHYSTLMDGPY